MKLKEFGPPGGRASLAPPLDPPMALLGCNGIAMTFKREVATARVRRYPIISMSKCPKTPRPITGNLYGVGTEWVRSGYGGGTKLWGEGH